MGRQSKVIVYLGQGSGNQEVGLGHVVFIMHVRHPSGHAKVAAGLMKLKLQ